MNEFSESESSEIGDATEVSEDFSEIEEAALKEVLEIGEVEGEGVQMDLQHDNWIRVPPQFNRCERCVAKEEMKDPFAPGAGYYSMLDNAEAHNGYRIPRYHDKFLLHLTLIWRGGRRCMMHVFLITFTRKFRRILRSSTSFGQFFSLGNIMQASVLLGMMVRACSGGSDGGRENGRNSRRNTCWTIFIITGFKRRYKT